MHQIFISYSSKDRKKTGIFVKILEKLGWSIWWDKNITPGKAFDRAISQALDATLCIIVLWSKNSVKSDWVMEEALEGMERKILIPVKIDSVQLPFGFRRLQTIDLSRWKGAISAPGIKMLITAVDGLISPSLGTRVEKQTRKTEVSPRPRKLSGGLDGKTIVFTGALSESRAVHAEKVNTVGAKFVDSVSSRTDYLVVGKDPGTVKLNEAKEHGIKKLTERQWLTILNNTYKRILLGKTVVFTGKLSHSRAQLEKIARKLGARPINTISRKTDYLILGEIAGQKKLTEAKKYHIKILKEAIWNEIVSTLKT